MSKECTYCGSDMVERVWEGEDARERNRQGEPPDYTRCHDCRSVHVPGIGTKTEQAIKNRIEELQKRSFKPGRDGHLEKREVKGKIDALRWVLKD